MLSRFQARPQRIDEITNPVMDRSSKRRRPSQLERKPVSGITTAAATI